MPSAAGSNPAVIAMTTEADLQKTVCAWLRLNLKETLWFAVPNEGKHHIAYRKHQKAMGMRPGVADLVFVGGGRVMSEIFFLELKTPKGRMSKAQNDFAARCIDIGVPYHVCRSLEEVQDIVKQWGLR